MKLSFTIAGVQKAGTSALHKFLGHHPQLYLPKQKELHFFDDETVDWNNPDYKNLYHIHFADAGESCLWGEATPIYTYWPRSLDRIRAYNADIKIIVSLRCPIERAFSQWRMHILQGLETLSFSDAIRSGRNRISEKAEIPGVHRFFSYVERGFYCGQLERLYDLFPRKNVLLLQQELLHREHHETLDKICSFLGVERFKEYPEREMVYSQENRNLPPLSRSDREYLEGLFEAELEDLKIRFGIVFS